MKCNLIKWNESHVQYELYQVSQKKGQYCSRLSIFKNDNTQQCNIFGLNKYKFYLVVCEVSALYLSKVMKIRRIMNPTGRLQIIKRQI